MILMSTDLEFGPEMQRSIRGSWSVKMRRDQLNNLKPDELSRGRFSN